MSDESTTERKRKMIVNCAHTNHGKSTALQAVWIKLCNCAENFHFLKMDTKGLDAICVFQYRGIVIGLCSKGDNLSVVIEAYNSICTYINEKDDFHPAIWEKGENKMPDVFITACHVEKNFYKRMAGIISASKYEVEYNKEYDDVYDNSKYQPNNPEQWIPLAREFAATTIKVINDYIEALL